ncbi:MAG: BON domain-containing protein [Wolbachia endosymbiont of Menacanthus eurysternus]|nr:MAG: BON domain-containing protein [Wolbachia endosymbiont of Menacanthus eurysternus]
MKLTASLLFGVCILMQSSCTPSIIGTSVVATVTATVIAQDKSLGNIVDDTAMIIRINSELIKYGLFTSVIVKVSEGRVLLIGGVNSLEKQLIAEKIAWRQKEVKEVINEIKVMPIQIASIIDSTVDFIITTKIRMKLLSKRNIKSVNYSVNTLDRIVYLMGIAQSKPELEAVMAVARKVKGVKQVVSYVRYKDSRLRH